MNIINDIKYSHINLLERKYIEREYKKGTSIREIARYLERSPNTISLEIKRNGRVKTNPLKYKVNNSFIYSAIQAQKRSDARIFLKLKGEKFKLFSEYAVDNLKIKMSLEDLFWNFQKSNPNENCPTLKTLYTWYHTNFIIYPNDVKVVKKYRNKVKGKVRDGRRSIHERPFELDDYSISSHYEIDTIYNSDKKGGLLTFTNRNTMMIYSSPISDRKASTINSSLRKIIEHIGIDNIDSITSDNGTEFSYTKVIECSYNLTWYYADPYCSGQRGQNERLNRDIRKYYNKGVDFKTVPIEEFNKVIDLINNKPRRKYGGLSAIEKSQQVGIFNII